MRWLVTTLLLFFCADGGLGRAERPLARALFSAAKAAALAEPAYEDEADYLRELDGIAARVRREQQSRPGASPATLLNDVVFGQLGFQREVENPSLEFVLLPNVLRHRRGNCVGLGALYAALGEALAWNVKAILLPGHLYVQISEPGGLRNVELLRRGERMAPAWYRQRFPIEGGPVSAYEHPLSIAELEGVVAYDIGQQRRRAGLLGEAEGFYRQASLRFPELAEARASWALVLHLRGDLKRARAEYLAAQLAYPGLAGVRENLAILEHELAAAAPFALGSP